jgi:hypothetical protein
VDLATPAIELWERYKEPLSLDFHLHAPSHTAEKQALHQIEAYLAARGAALGDFGLNTGEAQPREVEMEIEAFESRMDVLWNQAQLAVICFLHFIMATPPPTFPPTTPKSPNFPAKSASATPIAPCWNFMGPHSIYSLFFSEIGDLQTPEAQQLATIINAPPPKHPNSPKNRRIHLCPTENYLYKNTLLLQPRRYPTLHPPSTYLPRVQNLFARLRRAPPMRHHGVAPGTCRHGHGSNL